MSNENATTVLLCGVGGQGTILAADLLAHAALEAGTSVKVSEIHGMAQRGGAVTTVVRFGDEVSSMVCDPGTADCVVSFETTEALRNLSFLAEDGYLLVADEAIKPLPVATGRASMPARARETLADRGATLIPAGELAREAGSAKSVNVVLLGALSTRLPFAVGAWERVLADRVPTKTVEANLAAFRAGRAFALPADGAEGVREA
ncbi:indolepyruvate oxidoreductase subunit beta [Gordonibacter sp. RACS_AR68]|uniref:indolepyruvate oxidoreductase subunit beta n=1 Tax=Gordonibacter sp. RACS_AR68 TaxID=2872005 RepID=UPI0026188932|nr:indolepyruvate oxidoreductase subunit beta [Gordonibacter sp. RACS_AR68]MDN4471096.1 indolepyruvate oxidoreductase subunit beta [Gordonibacter sp. RACS_AR68]